MPVVWGTAQFCVFVACFGGVFSQNEAISRCYERPVVAIEDMSTFTAHLMDGTREASRKGFINKDSI
jgi:hypothetical protein